MGQFACLLRTANPGVSILYQSLNTDNDECCPSLRNREAVANKQQDSRNFVRSFFALQLVSCAAVR